MLVKVTDGIIDDMEMRGLYRIEVDGRQEALFIDGEPEDANMSRDFADVFSIPSLMRQAYEAGKRGDDFEVVSGELEDE